MSVCISFFFYILLYPKQVTQLMFYTTTFVLRITIAPVSHIGAR
jgi:hypothetical protein